MIQSQCIDTICTCGRPLVGLIVSRGGRTSLAVLDAADSTRQSVTICPTCRRRLPRLTPEQFKDAVGRGL